MNTKTVRLILLSILVLGLQACSSNSGKDNEVLGIGKGRDGLKRSVCWNCKKMKPFYKDGQWLK